MTSYRLTLGRSRITNSRKPKAQGHPQILIKVIAVIVQIVTEVGQVLSLPIHQFKEWSRKMCSRIKIASKNVKLNSYIIQK